jgi:hypothetical protein
VAKVRNVKLVIVVVLHDCERGIPVVYGLINHDDVVSLEIFFRTLLDQLQNLDVQWFLSDGATAFFSVWEHVVGGTNEEDSMYMARFEERQSS